MKTFSKAELIKDYNELDDRCYENSFKKELAEKYNTSKKIKDIQVAILEELRNVRSHSIVFDNVDIVFFNRLDGKFKDNIEKESIPFILFLKDFLTERMKSKNLFDKIGMHTKRDWNFIMTAADKYLIEKYVTIEKYLESHSEEYKMKNQKIEEIFNILVDSTQDFYRFYINRAAEQAERIYCNAESSIAIVKNEFERLQNDFIENSNQEPDFFVKYRTVRNRLIKLNNILSVSKKDFIKKFKTDADFDYQLGMKVVAGKLEKSGVNPETMKVVFTNTDMKYFELVINDNDKSFHARSIIAAEYSEKVQTHLRFIVTEKTIK